MTNWEKIARRVAHECGSYVDWDERFFQCPNCEDVVYEVDWDEDEYYSEDEDAEGFICPICEEIITYFKR